MPLRPVVSLFKFILLLNVTIGMIISAASAATGAAVALFPEVFLVLHPAILKPGFDLKKQR